MAYNVSGRERGMVRCVFCKHPNHFNGVVMRYKSGTRRLVGRDCASVLALKFGDERCRRRSCYGARRCLVPCPR